MKIVKRYKGFKIKQTSKKDKEEGYYTYEYYLFSPDDDDYAEWQCDSLEEAKQFIDSY